MTQQAREHHSLSELAEMSRAGIWPNEPHDEDPWAAEWWDLSEPSRARLPALLSDATAEPSVRAFVERVVRRLRKLEGKGKTDIDLILCDHPTENAGEARLSSTLKYVFVDINPLVETQGRRRRVDRSEMADLLDLGFEELSEISWTCTVVHEVRNPEQAWRLGALISAVALQRLHGSDLESLRLVKS